MTCLTENDAAQRRLTIKAYSTKLRRLRKQNSGLLSGVDPGGAIAPPLKPTKATFFTMIFYNSENSIRDIRPS